MTNGGSEWSGPSNLKEALCGRDSVDHYEISGWSSNEDARGQR